MSDTIPPAGPGEVCYFDHNATTPAAPEVVEAMLPWLGGLYGNPSSGHRLGTLAARAIQTAREQVASLLGAQPQEICFTSGGTESNTLAIHGALTCSEGTHLITSAIEHPAVLATLRHLKRVGYELTELPVDRNGLLNPADLQAAIRPGETALVSLMWANNETGVVQPMAALAAICAAAGVPLHTDAVQATGKIPIDLAAIPGITFLSLAGHKLHGPKGIGALFVRSGAALEPCVRGGHQERGLRAGTENVPGIVGLGVACELAARCLATKVASMTALRDRLEATILACIPDVTVNGAGAPRTPNTSNLAFAGLLGSTALLLLDQEGFACSAGSACSTGQAVPSHVLRAMGLSDDAARGSLRLSLSRYTTSAEVDALIAALERVVPKVRAMTGYTNPEAIRAYQASHAVNS